MTSFRIEEIREVVMHETSPRLGSSETDRLISEFVRKAIDAPDAAQALEWIIARAHELGLQRGPGKQIS